MAGVDRTPTNTAHTAQTHRTRLALELQRHLCAPEKNLSSGSHMSHHLLLSQLPCTTSTASSSFTLPSTTTPEHALQARQHNLLQEHPVHHQPHPERPVEKQPHQEPMCRGNQQSGGKPRNTFSTSSVGLTALHAPVSVGGPQSQP